MIETVDEIKERIKQLEKEVAELEKGFFADQSITLPDRKGQLKAYQDVLPFVEKLQKTIEPKVERG